MSFETHLFDFKSSITFNYFCRGSCFRTVFPTVSPFISASHSRSLKSNHVQATHKANNCEISGKSKSETDNAQLQLEEICVWATCGAESTQLWFPQQHSEFKSGSGIRFFFARLVWFLDNVREQKIPCWIPFWDLENCQNHQRRVAPQLSMASWQEIVKCWERETKLNTEGKTPHGKWELRVACENATQLKGNTLHVPHARHSAHFSGR